MVRGMCSVGFLHPKGMRGGGGRAWKIPFLHLGMEGWDWEGFDGITGTGVSMDKKECPGTLEFLMEKGFPWAWRKAGIRELLHEGSAWKTPGSSSKSVPGTEEGTAWNSREFQGIPVL